MNQAIAQPPEKKVTLRNAIIIIVTAIIYVVLSSLKPPEGLSPEGLKSIALMICALIIWVLDALPMGVTALVFAVLQPVLGIVNPNSMAANFMPTSFFFTLACFLISQALLETGLGNRIVLQLLRISGNNPRKLLFLLMCVTSLISFVIANLALSAMMVPLLVKIFEENGMEPGKSNYAKACLIGVPIAISIGGCGTPAGALPNYQAMSLLEQVTGKTISFGQWFALGAPLAIILTPLAYLVIIKIFKPEVKTLVDIDYKERIKELGSVSAKEIGFLVIFAALIASWFVFPDIPMPVSAIIACGVMFLPQIEILNGESFKKSINWNVLLLLCGATGLAMGIFQTGGAAWIASSVLSPFTGASPVLLIGVLIAFTIYMHLLIPANPSLVALLVPIVGLLAIDMGLSPVVLVLPLAYAANHAFLLPFDPVFVVTYSRGYYTMKDLPKAGVPISIAWIVVGTVLMALFGMGI